MLATKMHKKALYLSFISQNVQNLSFLIQNNAFLLVSADTESWATCPIRAVLR